MTDYWESRRHCRYYQVVEETVKRLYPNGCSILDVGAGIFDGVKLLERFSEAYRCIAIDLPPSSADKWQNIFHTQRQRTVTVAGNFMSMPVDFISVDVVLCLQVLEHVPEPAAFAFKLFECGRVIIISVPYKWEKGRCKSHRWDPIDEQQLSEWTGREPTETIVLLKEQRLVAIYEQAREGNQNG